MKQEFPPSNRPQNFASIRFDTAFNTALAENFCYYLRVPAPAMKRYLELIASEFPRNKRRLSMLDVGCGSGRFAIPFLTQFPRPISTVVAVDRSAAMIRQLLRKVATKDRNACLHREDRFL